LIAGDNRGAPASQRRGQHDIVVSVATYGRFERHGCDQGKRFSEQLLGVAHVGRALMEFSSQDIVKLVEQQAGRNHGVMADTVFEKVATDAARDESGDKHVRIQ
jgi:hypothetical protein